MAEASKDPLHIKVESGKPWIQTLKRMTRDSLILAIALMLVYFLQSQHDIYDHMDRWITAHGVNYHDFELIIFATTLMLLIFTTRGTIDFYTDIRRRREIEKALREEHAKS